MERMRQIWHYVVIEPLTLIFYAFFQPVGYSKKLENLYRETEQKPAEEKFRRLSLDLFLPLCLSIFFFSLFTRLIYTILSYLIHPQPFSVLLQSLTGSFLSAIVTVLLASLGITLVIAIAYSPATSAIERVEFYRSLISFSILLSSIGLIIFIDFGENIIAKGILLGLEAGILLNTVIDIYSLIKSKDLNTLKDNTRKFSRAYNAFNRYLTFFLLFMFIVVVFFGKGNTTSNVVGFCIFILCGIAGYYRLPFYLVSCPSFIKAYLVSNKNPSQVFTYMSRSSLHWDERVHLPLPYLKQTLLLAAQQDIKQTGKEIIFIVGERPLQARTIHTIYPTIILRTLETCENLRDIADLSSHFASALSQKKRLLAPDQEKLFLSLADISKQTANYTKAVSRRTRINQLEHMLEGLRTIFSDTDIDDEELNTLLHKAVETWTGIIKKEQDRLKNLPQEIGHIENPYTPGTVPKPGDSLFVGRQDVVQQLESALNRVDSIPPFLLNGERRIGKTSVLNQLPTMLDSHYLPIFYDLQKPGSTSSTARFLATIAAEINTVLTVKGIKIDSMEYQQLQKASKENEKEAYYVFDQWLQHLEHRLKHEDCTLLLEFDEFEKLAEAGKSQYLNLTLLLDWFRSTMQDYSRFAFLFSGVHTLEEMSITSEVSWSSCFVNVQTLRVSFLHPEEARQLITQMEPDSPGREIFASDVVEKIIRETGCHPFLVQAVCSNMINILNSEKRIHAEVQDVSVAVDQVVEKWWDSYFRDLWNRTDEKQRICLKLLKSVGEADISLLEQQSSLDTRTARRTMQKLYQRDLVQRDQDSIYRIAAPIFGEWVERSLYN